MQQQTEKQNSSMKNATYDGLSQLRDIIFGESFDSFASRIKRLERGLVELENRTEKRHKELSEKFNTALDTQNSAYDILNTELNQAKNEIRAILKKFRDELNEKISELNQKKIDRNMIGDLLIQVGNQTKGQTGKS